MDTHIIPYTCNTNCSITHTLYLSYYMSLYENMHQHKIYNIMFKYAHQLSASRLFDP